MHVIFALSPVCVDVLVCFSHSNTTFHEVLWCESRGMLSVTDAQGAGGRGGLGMQHLLDRTHSARNIEPL